MRVFSNFSKREKNPKSHPQGIKKEKRKRNPPFLCFDRVPLEFLELSGL